MNKESYTPHVKHLDVLLIMLSPLLVSIQLVAGKVKVVFQK